MSGSEGSTSRDWGLLHILTSCGARHEGGGATHPSTHLLFMKQPFPRERQRCGSVEGHTAGSDEDAPCCIHRETMAIAALLLAGLSVRFIPLHLHGRGRYVRRPRSRRSAIT